MTWGQEIFRAFLLALGTIEIITNASYLIKSDGLALARKQHGELPPNLSNKKIKRKVICMFSFGIAFFIVSLFTYVLRKYLPGIIFVTTLLFSLYGITEALYYRYWKTFGFAFVTILLLIGSIVI